MVYKDRDLDTICATATPSGVGGISVIRVSGSLAKQVTRHLCSFVPLLPQTHRVYFGLLRGAKKTSDKANQGPVIDEVLVTYFEKGRSFTFEETFEISCHGNPLIVREILSELVQAGARIADRGEFTYRAFMNGRIDLVQAESVLSLIESQSVQSAKQSLFQLQGSVSRELAEIENVMIWCLAHMEASIDFSTEDLGVIEDSALTIKVLELKRRIWALVATYKSGQILKDGFRLILTGVPNVGKSSLLNLLIGEDRAIVTPIAGTTRDIIEGSFMVEGLKVNVVDTAGLRESIDQIEKLGMEKSVLAQKSADGIFFIFDSFLGLTSDELERLSVLPLERTFLVGNKADQGNFSTEDRKKKALDAIQASPFFQDLQGHIPHLQQKIAIVSALDDNSCESLKCLIQEFVGELHFEDQATLFQARHFENLSAALKNMETTLELVQNQASPEFMSLEMKEALIRVQETIGKRFDDEIMDRVFKEFCIGK